MSMLDLLFSAFPSDNASRPGPAVGSPAHASGVFADRKAAAATAAGADLPASAPVNSAESGEGASGVVTHRDTALSGDSRLPAAAWAKLQKLADEKADIHAAAREVSSTRLTVNEELMRIEALIDATRKDVMYRTGKLGDDEEPLRGLLERERTLQAKLDRLNERAAALTEKVTPIDRLSDRCQKWLKGISPAARLSPVKVDNRHAGKGETAEAGVERHRRAIAEARTRLDAVHSAPWPSSVVKEGIAAEIDEMAEAGRPDVEMAVLHGDPIAWPHKRVNLPVHGLAKVGGGVPVAGGIAEMLPDNLSLTAWLLRDQLKAALGREVDAIADDDKALTREERTTKTAEIRAEILSVERAEVALIETMNGAIAYRENTDPRALLGVDGPQPAER